MAADPVSWFLIEAGWKVVDREGVEVGRIEQVLGDESRDIFDGLAVATTLLGKPRYVPAERVTTIVEGSVEVDLTAAEVERLRDYEP